MRYKISKSRGYEYIQIWSDDHKVCVNLGSAEKLVHGLLDEDWTERIRLKLTENLKGLRGSDD